MLNAIFQVNGYFRLSARVRHQRGPVIATGTLTIEPWPERLKGLMLVTRA